METEEEAAARRRRGSEVIVGLGEFVLGSPTFQSAFITDPAFAIGLHLSMAISAAMAHPEWGQAVANITRVPNMPPGIREGGMREMVEAVPVGGVS